MAFLHFYLAYFTNFYVNLIHLSFFNKRVLSSTESFLNSDTKIENHNFVVFIFFCIHYVLTTEEVSIWTTGRNQCKGYTLT